MFTTQNLPKDIASPQELKDQRLFITDLMLKISLATTVLGIATMYYLNLSVAPIVISCGSLVFCGYLSFNLTPQNRSQTDTIITAMVTLNICGVLLLNNMPFDITLLILPIIYTEYFEEERSNQLLFYIVIFAAFLYAAFYLIFIGDYQFPIEEQLLPSIGTIVFVVGISWIILSFFNEYNFLVLRSNLHSTNLLTDNLQIKESAKNLLKNKELELLSLHNQTKEQLKSEYQAIANLKAATEQLEQFSYAASHDLKEPVRTIGSFMQIASRKASKSANLDPKLLEYFSHVQGSTTWMNELLERLLIYTRLDRYTAKYQNINISKEIVKITNEIRSKSTHSPSINLSVSTDIEHYTDKSLFARIMTELIDNACKFSDDNTAAVVTVSATKVDGVLKVLVRDNGIGIEEQYQDQIFSLFKRLHTRDRYSGSGLGLALTQKAVKMLRGTIMLASTPLEGSSFRVHIPDIGYMRSSDN